MMAAKKNNNNFSIVISGWPAVGKTTVASKLAQEFSLAMYNGGDILKVLAAEKGYSTERDNWWDTPEAKKFMAERKSDPSFDKKVDKKLAEIVRKLWLWGSPENRAKRMANRDDISFAEAKRIIALRDEENKKIYHKLYGFRFGEDLTVFDYVLNTDRLPLNSLIEISKLIVRRQK
jgi:cytidylate kinase